METTVTITSEGSVRIVKSFGGLEYSTKLLERIFLIFQCTDRGFILAS